MTINSEHVWVWGLKFNFNIISYWWSFVVRIVVVRPYRGFGVKILYLFPHLEQVSISPIAGFISPCNSGCNVYAAHSPHISLGPSRVLLKYGKSGSATSISVSFLFSLRFALLLKFAPMLYFFGIEL